MSLHRIDLVKNHKYVRSGLKSYGYTIRKYAIEPTHEGPFKWKNHAHSQGKFGDQQHPIGGLTKMVRSLVFEPIHTHEEKSHHKPKHGSGTGGGGSTGGGGGGTTPQPPTTSTGGGTASGTLSTQPGTVGATDIQNDSEYLCPVTIGSPGQTLMLDFDTGYVVDNVFSRYKY